MAPTLLKLAGAPLADYFDGKPIDIHSKGGEVSETLAVEFWATNFVSREKVVPRFETNVSIHLDRTKKQTSGPPPIPSNPSGSSLAIIPTTTLSTARATTSSTTSVQTLTR
jgi:hypothetical protein